ncbi:MAG: sugar-binding protein, partial [Longimicrobiales bacterium]
MNPSFLPAFQGIALAVLIALSPLTLQGQVAAPPTGEPGFDPTERRTGELGDAEARELGLLPGRPTVRPLRADESPDIDGSLDDPVWERAAKITSFVQQAPLDGAPATEDTEVWLAYDDDHLYVAFHVRYEDPSIMRASRVDRDRAFPDDLMTIYLDTFLDQQRAYDFDINAYNVQGDGIISATAGGGGGGGAIPRADRSWDALFDSGARIVPDGFTAEMAIPFKSLRYPQRPEGEPHRWGFQIVREIKGKAQENDVWAPVSRDRSSFYAQMGLLEGMTDLSTSRNLEILPTFTAIQFGEIDPTLPSGPGFENRSVDPDAGMNVKYGLTSNLTADFTVNPDFSQIESDRP